ncbi:NAD-glutamate dehydrogenase [Thiotrichales bacterium 19S3-7]|nr:NAD-glutamate dehydrogenase [Thiotrichales bacterium 19S3-7]MCF6801760.1 NAD-glutamate dehydrogenase [Thiotrichales bacterium 19S3-11]
MSIHASEKVMSLLMKIEKMASKNLDDHDVSNIITMAKGLFNIISENDLINRDVIDLYGLLLSLWRFISKRDLNKSYKVRVYNPDFEEHGWNSGLTVIELVGPDKPFQIDTIQVLLSRLDIGMHSMMHIGGAKIERDKNGDMISLHDISEQVDTPYQFESLAFFEVDRQKEEDGSLESLEEKINEALEHVDLVVDDFEPMRVKLTEALSGLSENCPDKQCEDFSEAIAFIEWLRDRHFIFLGYCDLDIVEKNKKTFEVVKNSQLGLLKFGERYLSSNYHDFAKRLYTGKNQLSILSIAKSDHQSPVHRTGHMDIIGVTRYNEKGKPIGERRFLGLYTSIAYHSTPHSIPFLRQKVDKVLQRSNFRYDGHAYKTLSSILETYPRDELFLSSDDDLFNTACGILHIKERQTLKLFVRKDPYSRYYFCMVFLPRERYNSEIRQKIQAILTQTLKAKGSTFKTNFADESIHCRIDFTFYIEPNSKPVTNDISLIEDKLKEVSRQWEDDLLDALIDTYGESVGRNYFTEYHDGFTPSYKHDFHARSAAIDIEHFEKVRKSGDIDMTLYRILEEESDRVRFKLYLADQSAKLSHIFPILEDMGMFVNEERPYKVAVRSGGYVWISDFGLQVDRAFNIDRVKPLFQEVFSRVWDGSAENDRFNYLVPYAALGWRDVALIRALSGYLIQLGLRYSQNYIEETVIEYPDIVKNLVELFHVRFHPKLSKADRKKQQTALSQQIDDALANVVNRDHDRILRKMKSVILAIVRTNFYQTKENGEIKDYMSFKLKPSLIPGAPKPTPLYEIFVHSPRVEGVHLRFAKVARGGLRWSDRKEDYRTEVLGLVKAQQVKNAVIVPLGAKGGFYPKRLPVSGDRDEVINEAIACYKIFISGLLDVTDNVKSTQIIAPLNVVRHDEDDPYLVVAADKGTATFSDIANAVAADYGFWLGDAFASGGSNGYDHKKMGITARGAWESVKRHFKERGKNCQKEDFTVVGIGDMSGDVFGNGMLLSKHIRLIGAFNHMHIFVDPNPDATTSYKERKRLFELPRSSWLDYDQKLISKGGGIFERSAKSIKLSPEMKKVFACDQNEIEPNELIQLILKANVELLWNGGIGTYVKAESESQSEVGDKANEAVRINATELQTDIVGEGGNLGLTQLARIQFALNGGAVNTDAIDNSAGVDCSDHEVNIKILLNMAVESGTLTMSDRNKLLAEMAEGVAQLVLKNNYYQNQSIAGSLRERSLASAETYMRLMRELSNRVQLDREIEFLPSDKRVQTRYASGKGLTAPEFSVIMAYMKIYIKQELLKSKLPDEAYFRRFLVQEFPEVLHKKYAKIMPRHGLAREIIATQLTNLMLVCMGIPFVQRLYDETGASVAEIARAFVVAVEILGAEELWLNVDHLHRVPVTTLQDMNKSIYKLVQRVCRWLLRNHRSGLQVEVLIKQYQSQVTAVMDRFIDYLEVDEREKVIKKAAKYHQNGVDEKLAIKVAQFNYASPVLDLLSAVERSSKELGDVASAFFYLNEKVELGWYRRSVRGLSSQSYWGTIAASALRDDIDRIQCDLALSILNHPGKTEAAKIANWLEHFKSPIDRWLEVVNDLKLGQSDYVSLTIALRNLLDLAQLCRFADLGEAEKAKA